MSSLEGQNKPIGSEEQGAMGEHKQMNVALVSDFYYPFVGGVEIHIKQLATLLSKHERIGNLIIITHKYEDHQHRYTGLTNYHGFPVYYLNLHYNKQHMITYPTFLFNFSQAVRILKHQKIDIVHCHQTGSTLALEFIFFARILGLKVVLTEHSLYGLGSLADIHFNRVSRLFVSLCDKVIAVSKTTRNNIIVRAGAEVNKVVVIPNGVANVSHLAQIRQEKMRNYRRDKVRIISVGRMTYRRGTDLLIEILPQLCCHHEDIEVLIVGDGIKRKVLERIIEIYHLHNKVKLLGIISNHEKLLQTIADCDIFLNTPLTESFGIALAQAAMLGLYCVSTNVGGVEEAIPADYLFPAKVEPSDLLNVLNKVIEKVKNEQKPNYEHRVSFSYPWSAVAERTVQLYDSLSEGPQMDRKGYLLKTLGSGSFLQLLFCILAVVLSLVHLLPCFR